MWEKMYKEEKSFIKNEFKPNKNEHVKDIYKK